MDFTNQGQKNLLTTEQRSLHKVDHIPSVLWDPELMGLEVWIFPPLSDLAAAQRTASRR